MSEQFDPTLVYVCAAEEFEVLKHKVPKLVGLRLDRPIDPQLIYVAEELGGWISDRAGDTALHNRLGNALDSFLRGWQATKATHLHSHAVWATNSILNLPEYQKRGKDFSTLNRVDREGNALVIGNGPSVEAKLDWLEDNWANYTTIACWHVLPKLLTAGLTPEFIAHIDGRKPIFDSEPSEMSRVSLITIPQAYSGFIKAFPDSTVYVNCDNNKHTAQAVAEVCGFETGEPCYGTVVYLQCMAAVEMGCKSITLIGVDLQHSNPQLDAAYEIYQGNMTYFVKNYCPTNVELINLSGGRTIEGFIDGQNTTSGSTKCKQERRSRSHR